METQLTPQRGQSMASLREAKYFRPLAVVKLALERSKTSSLEDVVRALDEIARKGEGWIRASALYLLSNKSLLKSLIEDLEKRGADPGDLFLEARKNYLSNLCVKSTEHSSGLSNLCVRPEEKDRE